MFITSKLSASTAAVAFLLMSGAGSCLAQNNTVSRSKIYATACQPKSKLSSSDQPESVPTQIEKRPRVALALGGGGARGAAEIGVLKVLQEEHIPIDFISGTSIGAIIGGLYAAGVPLTQIEKMAEDKSIMRAFNSVPIPLRVALVPLTLTPRLVGIHHYVGLYSGKHFAKFLEQSLPEGRKNFEETIIPFRAVATDMLSGQPYVLDRGSLSKAMQASAAIPGLRKPVSVDGYKLCDGFLGGDNLPVKEARDMGADVVICVDVDGPLRKAPDSELHHIKSFENRTLNILIAKLDESRTKQADLVIYPEVADCSILSGNPSDAKKAFFAGEQAARVALPQIRKLTQTENVQNASSAQASPI